MANFIKLKQLITSDITNDLLTNAEISEKLNRQKTAKLNNKKYDALELINLLPAGVGGSILAKIKTASLLEEESGELKWVIDAISLRGLEIGAETTQKDLANLVKLNVISQPEFDALNTIATEFVLDILDAGFTKLNASIVNFALKGEY